MFLKDGGKDGPAPEPKACKGSRPTWLSWSDGEAPWLIRSRCMRSFTELPEGDSLDPSECTSLVLLEGESEG